jgi:polyisoprenoid-binding protein YceI
MVIAAALAVPVALAQSPGTALDVKASGKKTFYVNPRAGNSQVSVFSQSTLEDFTTVCNRVSGLCTFDPKNLETFAGKFSLRVEDMNTGIGLRNEHLRSADWFDAAKHPEVVVEFTKVEEVRKTEANVASMKLVGKCSMHGKSNPIAVPCTLSYLDESPTTQKTVKGDLIRIRAEFSVKLSDYGITGPTGAEVIELKVSDVQALKVSVFASTEPPPKELQPDKEPASTAPAVKPPPPPKKP